MPQYFYLKPPLNPICVNIGMSWLWPCCRHLLLHLRGTGQGGGQRAAWRRGRWDCIGHLTGPLVLLLLILQRGLDHSQNVFSMNVLMVFLFLIPKGNKQDRLVGKFFDSWKFNSYRNYPSPYYTLYLTWYISYIVYNDYNIAISFRALGFLIYLLWVRIFAVLSSLINEQKKVWCLFWFQVCGFIQWVELSLSPPSRMSCCCCGLASAPHLLREPPLPPPHFTLPPLMQTLRVRWGAHPCPDPSRLCFRAARLSQWPVGCSHFHTQHPRLSRPAEFSIHAPAWKVPGHWHIP